MKFIFTILLISSSLLAQEKPLDKSEEIVLIEDLILTTKKRLEEEKKLLHVLRQFHEKREAFLQEPESAKYASQLVMISMKLQKDLENSPFASLFSTHFLEEVAFFSTIGQRATHAATVYENQ